MPRVTFVSDGIAAKAADGEKLVTVCEREVVSVMFGCKGGTCGTCLVQIKKGAEHLEAPGDAERGTLAIYGAGENHRLACQCVIRGDIEVDDP